MGLAKLSITPLDGKNAQRRIEALFNPKEYTVSKSVPWNPHATSGLDAPEMQFYLNPHWKFLPDWSLDGQWFWIGDRNRQADDPREDIDDYNLVNLTLRKKNIADHVDLALSVRNVFDADAREPSPYTSASPAGAYIPNDYPMEGRAIWGEVRFHL